MQESLPNGYGGYGQNGGLPYQTMMMQGNNPQPFYPPGQMGQPVYYQAPVPQQNYYPVQQQPVQVPYGANIGPSSPPREYQAHSFDGQQPMPPQYSAQLPYNAQSSSPVAVSPKQASVSYPLSPTPPSSPEKNNDLRPQYYRSQVPRTVLFPLETDTQHLNEEEKVFLIKQALYHACKISEQEKVGSVYKIKLLKTLFKFSWQHPNYKSDIESLNDFLERLDSNFTIERIESVIDSLLKNNDQSSIDLKLAVLNMLSATPGINGLIAPYTGPCDNEVLNQALTSAFNKWKNEKVPRENYSSDLIGMPRQQTQQQVSVFG